ncbi:hypothetical protein O1B84_003416 [Vibrio cholerae]|uniref:hypothetical protein n=1 Tax=Vibrio TaxID=662 RepID=UPI000DE3BB94|nr:MULTISPECIES: hypothetical protein [Vibrio]EGR0558411.1 hypothetical protein [Vibrio cholerae]EGR0683893.1 hypothetical protein [Vibrio cholerae]EGR2124005.1 hypothetical protein [Vibrio cholerae]EGR2241023.1 hypothetical protein [Vibrio cholerae]EHY9847298.1 hypothetical protein [Vibrio cholerae]
MKRDLEFINELVEQFFGQKHIRERLNHIELNKITGWEIWLQIEFSVFIDSHIDVAEWCREYPYAIDRRSARHRKNMIIDFVLRKRHAALSQYVALEIKQNIVVSSCIRGMMEDVCKVWLVRDSENDLRSMWCLGVHPSVPEDEAYACIEKYADEFGVTLSKSHRVSQVIKGTNMSYTLF